MSRNIEIKGARTNNLKNLNVTIPTRQLTVVTGVSGSGKTSLVMDTLYAEGQRRYVESISSYARQFLDRMKKPEVDYIKGLAPAIALEQKTAGGNARSTVGSLTEIYDFLRLLFARVGETINPHTGLPVKKDSISDVVDFIKNQKQGSRVFIYSPLHYNYPDRILQAELDILNQKGYSRILVNNEITEIQDFLESEHPFLHRTLGDLVKEDIRILIDRLILDQEEDTLNRLKDSIQTAYYESGGTTEVQIDDEWHHFNSRFEQDGIIFLEPSPAMFNYNNPYGACPRCEGFGRVMGIDEDKVVPNPTLSLYEGAIVCWNGEKLSAWQKHIINTASESGFPIHKPYKDLTSKERKMLWNGTPYFSGINDFFNELAEGKYKIQNRILLARYRGRSKCPDCDGNRLRPESEYVKVGGASITELIHLSLDELLSFIKKLDLSDYQTKIASIILSEITDRLENLIDLGLAYLHLDRLASTLSGGESQRINLTKSIGSNLTASMYILDEPSIGLHPKDSERLIKVLKKLRDLGNTVIVVEHEEEVIRAADYLVDIGPGAGAFGGNLVFSGNPDKIKTADSLTAEYLRGTKSIPLPEKRRKSKYPILIKAPYKNNLKGEDVTIYLKAFNVITGVSGSGKSTLVRDVLVPNVENKLKGISDTAIGCEGIDYPQSLIDNVDYVGQKSIGKSSRSNPVTYVKAYDAIRKLFANTNLSKIRGYQAKHFSFNVEGGRCPNCKGDGEIEIEMQFLADVKLTCDVCKGKRFKKEILEVRFKDKNIHDVLELSIEEALDFFSEQKEIKKKIQPLFDVGLGYLRLGQSTSTLSGGESQRLKLASYLASRKGKEKYLFIFDEPTTGLHFQDIEKLLSAFNALIDAGHTIVVIEHNLDVIKCADWVVDLGPDGGNGGGHVVGSGTPEEIAAIKESYTGKYLKEKL